MLKIMWMTNIASVVLKYVWYSTYVLKEINQKLILIVPDHPRLAPPSRLQEHLKLAYPIFIETLLDFGVFKCLIVDLGHNLQLKNEDTLGWIYPLHVWNTQGRSQVVFYAHIFHNVIWCWEKGPCVKLRRLCLGWQGLRKSKECKSWWRRAPKTLTV
jgi:hypothetical protein